MQTIIILIVYSTFFCVFLDKTIHCIYMYVSFVYNVFDIRIVKIYTQKFPFNLSHDIV